MTKVLNKLKEAGVKVDLIRHLPLFWLTILMFIFIIWSGSTTFLNVTAGWFLGMLVGIKITLSYIGDLDKDEG